MEIFAPHNLPGVGMGNLTSIAGVCGLVGLAVTSGMLIAEGIVGTLVFVASALAVLTAKEDLGGNVEMALVGLAILVFAAILRTVLGARTRRAIRQLAGAAADAPETRAGRAAVSRRDGLAQALTIVSVLLGGALVGFAWAEWNEWPFRLGDAESIVGTVIGLTVAAIGGDAAGRFLAGAVRAGGSTVVVGIVVAVVAYALNAASFYVPFAGAVVLVIAITLAIRLRRRTQQKYAGLRILN
ncbi:MAG: hypothetical protein H7287_06920 [Thermoleophilia bacterium]|nr:hypothetical protein [Thermoleophilia bacterium]